MKTLVMILSLVSVQAFAKYDFSAKVKPENMKLAKEVATYDDFGGLKGFKIAEADLHRDALYAWKAADREFRGLDGIVLNSGAKVIEIQDAPEGNGCNYYFNTDGDFLNSLCGGESSEWNWQVK